MPTSNSPYSAFAALLASSGYTISPAELHGLLLGRSCAGAGFEIDSWLVDAAELLGAAPEDTVRQALIGLQEMVKNELTSNDVTVVLLLPSDDAPLSERAVALGQWCQGFLGGFGVVPTPTQPLSDEADEALQDLAKIAASDLNYEDSDADEEALIEVCEYIRVAAVLLYNERVVNRRARQRLN